MAGCPRGFYFVACTNASYNRKAKVLGVIMLLYGFSFSERGIGDMHLSFFMFALDLRLGGG